MARGGDEIATTEVEVVERVAEEVEEAAEEEEGVVVEDGVDIMTMDEDVVAVVKASARSKQ